MPISRRQQAKEIRISAAELAANRPHPRHINNGDELRFRKKVEDPDPDVNETQKIVPTYMANYTKGLPHDINTGLLKNPIDYELFVKAINSGNEADFRITPLGPADKDATQVKGCPSVPAFSCNKVPIPSDAWESEIARQKNKVRAWESESAGLIFDLEGPDAQSVTMPPAPAMNSPELAAEMAEVYLMALNRDINFENFFDPDPKDELKDDPNEIKEAREILKNVEINKVNWFRQQFFQTDYEENRHRDLKSLKQNTIFRGTAPGDDVGPYISQFLLIGNNGIGGSESTTITDGRIRYGAITASQRVRIAKQKVDFMTDFKSFVDVQNGADVSGTEKYNTSSDFNLEYRFITYPRDIATYVHFDALYEAYLNATLILLGLKVPFDPAIPFQNGDVFDHQQGFASFGGPHILTLVTEVATRALKAVRFQKFNVHRRLRPEALAGLIDRYKKFERENTLDQHEEFKPLKLMVKALDDSGVLDRIKKHNAEQNQKHGRDHADSYLLPMAFPEGSPMHPSYGAGHATVAGACVTILKAFFDHGRILDFGRDNDNYIYYVGNENTLKEVKIETPLTVEGELNKLAANIAIGRDWAGVHYFTDYIESLRLGEQIALGMLEEQKLTYGENFRMTIPLFDGGVVQI